MQGYIVGFFIAAVILFLGFIALSFTNYKAKYKQKYNIRNMFPYELNFKNAFADNITGNLCLILYVLVTLGFYIICFYEGFIVKNYYVAVIAITINVLMSASLVFVPLNAVKLHLGVGLISLVSSIGVFGSIGFVLLTDYQILELIPSLILGIISLVFCLFYFGVTMNPKLNSKINYETKQNEDGTVSYIRPKYFVLAFSEWLSIFTNLIAMVIIFLFLMI